MIFVDIGPFKPKIKNRNNSRSSTYMYWSGDSDVGDIFMLVTLRWWLNSDVGGKIIMLGTFFDMLVIFSMY